MKKKYIIFDDTKNNINDILTQKNSEYEKNISDLIDNTNTNSNTNLNTNTQSDKNCIKNEIADKDENEKEEEKINEKQYENNNVYLRELLKNQKKNIDSDKKLNFNDIKRISKFLSSSIFDQSKCSIWNGYVTNEKNQSKGTYINFYFNKKKIALHRLLYINYVEDISNNEYIKFTCDNKGKCCNINHMKRYTYNTCTSAGASINDTIELNDKKKDKTDEKNNMANGACQSEQIKNVASNHNVNANTNTNMNTNKNQSSKSKIINTSKKGLIIEL